MNENETSTNTTQENTNTQEMKFCIECGKKIAKKAVICPHCGCQVENLDKGQQQPSIIINNSNQNSNANEAAATTVIVGRKKNKWVALVLLIFLGVCGGHKFYEGKTGMGILYMFTGGLFLVGVIMDFIALLAKPNPYYV